MTGERGRDTSKEAQIEAVATELDRLLDQLSESVDAISVILRRPEKQPPEPNVKVVPDD